METVKMHGFVLLKEEVIPELRSTLQLFRHEQSGAELLYLKNDDENKVFGAAFRTPPPDGTGVPHIIEHCVLSGSRKYKTKEPFMDLVQTSLATFLNAITYPDKTIYPVASRNDKDFANLMDVYLDAVFYPVIAEDERIFRQEGWRYELESPEAELRYSGVVYNEMRGAFSSAFEVLYEETTEALLPDTIYANNSGGEPYTIPELSYENFKAFHAKYYHPSNTRLFLYGKMDLAERMAYLDREYLSHFEKIDPQSEINWQKPFTQERKISRVYSLAEGEDTENKNYLVWAVMTGCYADIKENYMLQVLADMLFSAQSAPVRLALQEKGLCQDLAAEELMYQQSSLAVFLLNTPAGAASEYRTVIEDVLRQEISRGLDRAKLKASLNRIEYSLREGRGFTTLGILYFMKSLDSWLYGGDPGDQLCYADILAELRAELDSDIWEKFVEEKFLQNPHKVLLELKPEPGLNERKDKAVADKLAALKASMSEEEIAALVAQSRAMAAWQTSEDSPEAKAGIPKLALKDLSPKLPDPPCVVSADGADEILESALFTSDIHYLHMSFPLTAVPREDLFAVAVLRLLLGSVDTARRDYKSLDTETYLETGGISFSTEVFRHSETKEVIFRFYADLKTLDAAGEKWPELLREILTESRFTDDKRILELLKMELLNKEQSISARGNDYGCMRLRAQVSESGYLQEELDGISYYLKLKHLTENFAEEKEELKAKLSALAGQIFTRGGVLLFLTTDEEHMPAFREAASRVLHELPAAEKKPLSHHFTPVNRREAFKISSNVQYVSAGYDYELLGDAYKGDMTVLSLYLSRSYLHNLVRAKGGAYGVGLSIGKNGEIVCSSYRDPEVEKTLAAYRGMAAWLRKQALSEETVEQLIIGSMNRFDPPLSPPRLGALAYVRYLTGRTAAQAEANLAEAMAATPASLKSYADLLDQAMAQNIYCVIGSSSVLEEKKDLFDELVKL